jgi:hypothetical protein
MATLDDVKSDFESYKTAVDAKFSDLNAKIQALLAGAVDQTKLDAIDAEIKQAQADLNPPVPATPPADPGVTGG